MVIPGFHPAAGAWFAQTCGRPTAMQLEAWAAIAAGRHTLISAPTGSGKTLAGFLAVIDRLLRRSAAAPLPDQVKVLYISPLKALSNDIERNLRAPLAGIAAHGATSGVPLPALSARVRTGDTPAAERRAMLRRPPHILVTTPESLFILLASAGGRRLLGGIETVIVDELHALAGNKRGCHLSLSLARLAALLPSPPQRIGLSATVQPLPLAADWLTGGAPCTIVDHGRRRALDLDLELPAEALGALLSNAGWEEVYDRLAAAVEAHRTTLVFVNSRRLAERVARHLSDRLGDGRVAAHHGSLAREQRLAAEQGLKNGHLKVVVATASLELGIDIGHIDLVCQLQSPRSLAVLLQRAGRAGHALDRLPKARLWPLSLEDLVECTALLHTARAGEIEDLEPAGAALDVLAQHLIAAAEPAAQADELYQVTTRAWPYRSLERHEFDAVLAMIASGYSSRPGRRLPYLEWDRAAGKVRSRGRGAQSAMMNAGAIPDHFDYDVHLLPDELYIGTLNEDFAFESIPGDIFQLGNHSYRIVKVESGRVWVSDAKGVPPGIPFWFGDAPGRSDRLSRAVCELYRFAAAALDRGADLGAALATEYRIALPAAAPLAAYLETAYRALGALPDGETLIFERFFDATDNYHLIIHTALGVRLNRALGLALRKRFCRRFNFELQATATDQAVLLSLGPTHSFPLAEVAAYLNARTVRELLIQALLVAPMFQTRWRWNATIALAVLRVRNGKRQPPQFQRNDAEDLLALVFPDAVACQENLSGDRAVPDHPLIRQTLHDCLEVTMDCRGLEEVLSALEAGRIRVQATDLNAPSPLAGGILNARPWAFLDDGAAEERRTQAVDQRPARWPAEGATLAIVRPEAIATVNADAAPRAASPDDLHDALVTAGFLTAREATGIWGGPAWGGWFTALAGEQRAFALRRADGETVWCAAERLALPLALWPAAVWTIAPPEWLLPAAPGPQAAEPLVTALALRLQVQGLVTAAELAVQFALPIARIEAALAALQGEGSVVAVAERGCDAASGPAALWGLRHHAARVRRLSREARRNRETLCTPQAWFAWLLEHHGLGLAGPLADGQQVLGLLEGWAAPAAVLRRELCTARHPGWQMDDMDRLLLGGRWWWRAARPAASGLVNTSPVTLVSRHGVVRPEPGEPPAPGTAAEGLLARLRQSGALFFDDLSRPPGGPALLAPQADALLRELAGRGLVHADSWSALERLLMPDQVKRRLARRLPAGFRLDDIPGRWSALVDTPLSEDAWLQGWAAILLRRYGIVHRAVVEPETLAPRWSQLCAVLRRMEDREEVRGGRFVSTVAGEQFAAPGVTPRLIQQTAERLWHASPERTGCRLSSRDPLAAAAVLAGAPKLPAKAGYTLVFVNGRYRGAGEPGAWHWQGAPWPDPLPTSL